MADLITHMRLMLACVSQAKTHPSIITRNVTLEQWSFYNGVSPYLAHFGELRRAVAGLLTRFCSSAVACAEHLSHGLSGWVARRRARCVCALMCHANICWEFQGSGGALFVFSARVCWRQTPHSTYVRYLFALVKPTHPIPPLPLPFSSVKGGEEGRGEGGRRGGGRNS